MNGTSKLDIVVDGDSWVFGCEIVCPTIAIQYPKDTHPGAYDYIEANDSYRIPKIFPTHLASLLNANVTNISWPADDNGTILRRTIGYITNNYLVPKKSTDNLLVIIGWSSPERNSFWFKNGDMSRQFRLWPQVKHFDEPVQEEFWKLYVTYMWHAEEYMVRYAFQVLQFQNFCDSNNINWMCFNSFYQTPNKNVHEWNDLDVEKELLKLGGKLGGHTCFESDEGNTRQNKSYDYSGVWGLINPIRFYKKNQPNNTFKSYIENPNNEIQDVFNGWHPSPESHKAWAKELTNYIKTNNII